MDKKPPRSQAQHYRDIITSHNWIEDILNQLDYQMKKLNIQDYLLAGGATYQIIWNYLLSLDSHYGLHDIDITYFDHDLSEPKEAYIAETIRKSLAFQEYDVEIVNQARAHLWYEQIYGFKTRRLVSLEDAVGSWMTTCSCIGIRQTNNSLKVIAPYGLDDIFNMIIRPNNQEQKSKSEYYKKADKLTAKWNNLTVIPWGA